MITDEKITKYKKIDDREVPVWIYGDEKNPLIYFVHGYFRGFSDYIGDLPVRYLLKNYCVIAFDLPGFGYLKNFRKDRVTFIAEMIENTSKGRRFTLFGTSYGGLLALKYYIKYPDRVKGIIIAGMPYFFGFRKLINVLKLPIVRRSNISRTVDEFKFLNKDNLSKIKVPVLLLYSSNDRQASSGMGDRIQKILPNAEIFTINKYNHKWLLHRIDESGFLNETEKFIRNLT